MPSFETLVVPKAAQDALFLKPKHQRGINGLVEITGLTASDAYELVPLAASGIRPWLEPDDEIREARSLVAWLNEHSSDTALIAVRERDNMGFVIVRSVLEHMYDRHGENWPLPPFPKGREPKKPGIITALFVAKDWRGVYGDERTPGQIEVEQLVPECPPRGGLASALIAGACVWAQKQECDAIVGLCPCKAKPGPDTTKWAPFPSRRIYDALGGRNFSELVPFTTGPLFARWRRLPVRWEENQPDVRVLGAAAPERAVLYAGESGM